VDAVDQLDDIHEAGDERRRAFTEGRIVAERDPELDELLASFRRSAGRRA
jgi:hypothetical protein